MPIFSKAQELPMLRKSRSGCRDCRLRKVKCDEIKPVCSNCRRRYVTIQCCDWGAEATSSNRRNIKRLALVQSSENATMQSAMVGQPLSAPTLRPYSLAAQSPWRAVELRLMHHYAAVVSHSMPDCNRAPAKDMWQRTIPQLAFNSELVLNPMLALSALHFHVHSPNDPSMGISVRRYLDQTLINHRQALSGLDHGLFEQLWLSAIILSNMYWLIAHQNHPDEKYELPIQAWKMTQGISILYMQRNTLLDRLGYSWFGQAWSGLEIQPLITTDDQLSTAAQMQLQSIERDLEYLLFAFGVAAQLGDDKEVCIEARDYVLYHYRAFYFGATAETLRLSIGAMAVRCHQGYRTMLENHNPLAMALMARMLVLLCGLKPVWWINGGGDYEVLKRDIQGIYELMPVELRWAMDWPCGVLDGDIVLSRVP